MITIIDSFSGEYEWLSNFHLCPVRYEGFVYPSSEHAYQAAKVPLNGRTLFQNPGLTCGDAKRLGRRVKARDDWNHVRVFVMETILLEKFTRNPQLADKLLATGDRELIEGNHWGDTFWGVCRGEGENRLGLLLMELRDRLWRLYHGLTRSEV